jgi:hypothetical protein
MIYGIFWTERNCCWLTVIGDLKKKGEFQRLIVKWLLGPPLLKERE